MNKLYWIYSQFIVVRDFLLSTQIFRVVRKYMKLKDESKDTKFFKPSKLKTVISTKLGKWNWASGPGYKNTGNF